MKNKLVLVIGGFVIIITVLVLGIIGAIIILNNDSDDTNSENSQQKVEVDNTIEEVVTNSTNEETIVLTAKLDSEKWEADGSTYYYPNGNEFLGESGKNYFQASFYGVSENDSRQILIQIIDFKPEVGKYKGQMEVSLTGSPTGNSDDSVFNGYQDDLPEQKTDFTFEITKWENISESEAKYSAKFSGTLKGIFGAPDVKFTDGVITDAEVTIY